MEFQLRKQNTELRGWRRFKSLLLTLSTFLLLNSTFAQVYPVNVSIFTSPPHRNYLSSYADDSRLRLALTLTDFSVPSRTVRLKLRFEAPNGFVHESQLISPISYTLFSGETKVLTSAELLPYFVSSQSSQDLLYEGASSICIEVTDVQTGSLLNFNSCTFFQIDYGKTAQCVLPECESVFEIGTNYMLPTPIEFTFSPPFAPQNEFGNVRNKIYVFQYDSLIPQQNLRPPLGLTSVILGGFPFEVPIGSANYLPAPNMLLLEKGKKYMWMVRSVLIDPITGLERINQFEHDGWSMPCIFQYGEKESIAESLLNGVHLEWNDGFTQLTPNSNSSNTGDGLQAHGERKAVAKYKVVNEDANAPAFSLDKYIVSYRKLVQAGQEPWDWHHDTTTELVMPIYQLEPSNTYEVYIRGMLGNAVSDSTPVRNVTTDSVRHYACGEQNVPARMPIYEPLLQLEAGNTVKIGTFDLKVTSVQTLGETGHYKGYGFVPVTFLGGVNTKVRFDDLKIDKEFVVWEGTADVLTDGLNAWLEEQYIQFQDPIFVNGTVSSAYISDSLAYVVIDGTPQSFTFPCASCPVIINDVNGNQITIYANGTINWGTYLDVTGELLGVNNTSVGTFSQHENEIGGFDAKEHMQWHENYEIIQSLDSMAYFVPNKSMFVGEADFVNLKVHKDSFPIGSIELWCAGNTISEGTSLDQGNFRIIQFDLASFSSSGKKVVYAKATSLSNTNIAKLNIEVYEKLDKNVKIIPIASTNLTASVVESYIEQTLGEAGINFTVTIEPTFSTSSITPSITVTVPNTTLMVKYSPQMRLIRDAYFEINNKEDDTYYLFVVANLQDSSGANTVDGYMVRGKSVGFISANAGLQSIAHELGHGIGALEHSWKNNGPAEGSSTNLMDYSPNTPNNLIKSQWDEIRNPKGNSIWDDAESGKLGGSFAFTPDLEPIIVPSQSLHVDKVKIKQYSNEGTLVGFVIYHQESNGDTTETQYDWDKDQHKYRDFQAFQDKFYTEPYGTPTGSSKFKIIMGNNEGDCNRSYYQTSYSQVQNISNFAQLYNFIDNIPIDDIVKISCVGQSDDENCTYLQNLDYENINSLNWRIHQSSNSCLKRISDSEKLRILRILIANIGKPDVPIHTPFNSIGISIIRLIEAGKNDANFRRNLKSLIEENNYQFLRKINVNCTFSEVTHSLFELVGRMYFVQEKTDITAQMKSLSVFDQNVQYSSFFDAYVIGEEGADVDSDSANLNAYYKLTKKDKIQFTSTGKIYLKETYQETFGTGKFIYKYFYTNGIPASQSNPNSLSGGSFMQNILGKKDSIRTEVKHTETKDFLRSVDPFEPILFVFTDQINGIGVEKGKVYLMPAIWGYCMEKTIQENDEKRWWRHFGNTAAIVGGTLAAPFTGGASFALAVGGVGVATADELLLVVKDNQTLTEYHNSENFYMAWEIFYNTVMIADGLVGAYHGINSLPQLCQMVRELKLLKHAGKLIKPEFYNLLMNRLLNGSSNNLANAFKPGYSKEGILAIPKGSRPNPSVYLKEQYISNHINKFESEGIVSRIVSKNDYNNYGVGKPDVGKTEFVGLKSEIDNVLTLSLNEQSIKLGIPIEQLQNGNLVRIDFSLSNEFKVRMPSGNEFGANIQWLPGGKLPTGLNEAVISTEGMQLNINYIVTDL